MKRLTVFLVFLVVVLLIMPLSAQAVKRTWQFSLITPNSTSGVSAYSGCTTSKTATLSSGVSKMARRYGPISRELKNDPYVVDLRDGDNLFMAKIIDLDPSQAATGTTDFSSGTTAGLFAKVVTKTSGKGPTADDWAKVDYMPIFTGLAINSGVTPLPIFFNLPLGSTHAQFYFLPSGITPFDLALVAITTGYKDLDLRPASIPSGRIYSLNANSGISTTGSDDNSNSLPTWANYGEMYIVGDSGNSVFYTKDDSSIDRATAMTLSEGDYRGLTRHEMQKLNMEALGTLTVRIDCYPIEP